MSEDAQAAWRRRARFAALGCLAFLTLVGTPSHRGGNTASRLATVESLVHRGTFDITDSPFRAETVDYVQLDGRFVSTKPPMLPALAAGVYWVLHQLTGLHLHEDVEIAHRLLIFVVQTVPWALALWAAFLWLRLVSDDPRARGWAFLLLCFGFFGAGYATTLSNHPSAAAAILGGLYLTTKAARAEEAPWRQLALGGFVLGLASTFDFLVAPVCVGFFAMVVWRWPKATLLAFVPAALVPIGAHLWITWLITGGVLPIYANFDLYLFEGGYWNHPTGMDALDEPKHVYAFHLLFGHHGLFLLTPILGWGVVEAVRQVRARGSLWREALVALVALVVVTVAMIIRTTNYGGACIGFRWLIPVMPLFILLCLPWLERHGSIAKQGFAVAFLVSISTFVNAAVHPWSHSGIHWLFHQAMDTGANL